MASRRRTVAAVFLALSAGFVGTQARAQAPRPTVREYQRIFPTYPFSDPNPIPIVGRIYPYFRFDGFTDHAEQRAWKVVELENEFIKVMILPEIGGKIWNAVEKRTGRSFIYFNEVVKFRDIAMRGPWTSGGIEANYGIIGHTPNVSTPVDYVTRVNPDGSVSCIIGALDLLTRTPWRLDIRLGAHDAAFSTTSSWYNASPLEQPYYSWMNVGIPVRGNLEFVFPGTRQLGHAGEHGTWPIGPNGKDVSWYDNNDFGGYKSYHVFGQEADFSGAYWHDHDFGMVRYAPRDEKAGKKIWIWGLSRQGMIWEDLLTDSNGQYAEVQSGRLFNQSTEASTFTPFKHRGFAPHTTDRWTEYWSPVVGTKGFVAASRVGALNVTFVGSRLVIALSPAQPVADTLGVYSGARRIYSRFVARSPLAIFADTIAIGAAPRDSIRVELGDHRLEYREDGRAGALARPLDAPPTFDWHSAYGLSLRGKEFIRQRDYAAAQSSVDSALARDPFYVPALADRAMLAIRRMDYDAARRDAAAALSVDTYDGAANYYYGVANRRLGRLADAKDGFEIAASSPEYRGAAWTELARLASATDDMRASAAYSQKALDVEPTNLDALGLAIVSARRTGATTDRARLLARLHAVDPLSHQVRLERMLASHDPALPSKLLAGVRSELPQQVLLELAAWYSDAGDTVVARQVLKAAGDQPEALYWRAFLAGGAMSDSLMQRANTRSPVLVFPFRPEVIPALQAAMRSTPHWKPRYYLALSLWANGRVAEAASLLNALGDTPDFAPVYAARATLPGQSAAVVQRDLRRAASLDTTDWRYGKLLAEHLLASGDVSAAVDVARRSYAQFPMNYILGLTLAKVLVAAANFHAADTVLASLHVLPYEGASDGHVLYRQTKLKLAEEAMAQDRWDDAAASIAAARLWPERLGAGKPYDAELDMRAKDSLDATLKTRRASGSRANPTSGNGASRIDSLRYGTGVWEPDSLGNHRAVVHVATPGDAVFAHIPWRRRDASPEKVNVVVIDAATGRRILNVARMEINREFGDIVFQAPTAGDYYLYYLPYTGTFTSNYPKITYRVVEQTADAAWIERHALGAAAVRAGAYQTLPVATPVGFDAVNAFSRFTPMEYIATAAERDALIAGNPTAPFLAFAEDRSLSIRMADDIPQAWAARGAFTPFAGSAKRGEYFTFQIGVWAHHGDVDSLRYIATSLKRRGSADVIPASAITSINLEGTDWSGRHFTRILRVPSGKVQALWFGIDVPTAAVAGDYEGRVTLLSRSGRREVPISIHVQPDVVAHHGDDAPAQLTRLRWLNSQMAVDDSVVAPYTPMRIAGSTVSLLGRSLTFGADGMPTSIKSFFNANNTAIGTSSREILAAPARLVLRDSAGRDLAWAGGAPRVTKRAAGAVAWETSTTSGALRLQSRATLECDGTAEYTVALHATSRTTLADVRFELPMKSDAAKYMMGLGQKGGYRPASFHWTWDVEKKNQDAAWLGDVNAGVQFTLKDEGYVRPLNTNFYLSKPLIAPRSWANDGKGGCDVTGQGERVLVSCYSGRHVIEAGDSLRFDFRLMITPFKPLDTRGQWGTRYFHAFVPADSIVRRGANTVNVHHANRVNPWINYPFIETAGMRSYIDSTHARGLKTKIYYTVRELTDHAPEIFALRSLGDEVLSHGPGGGFSWLQEHLGTDYIAAWHVPEIKDAAIVNSGVSRWHNFYIEGLNWLVQNERIDGLYLDDVAFDRLTMKRVRKVLDRGNPGALLDLHSANQFNPRDGFASSANLYLEHFPFINRLWFGEYFDYDSRPDYWLVEISGIPFGLMGEMLEKGGNPWRGMTMGMTARLPWSGDPAPLWKAWDAFGIQGSQMHGWWSGRDPVAVSDSAVLATTWTRPGAAMVSLGSWRDGDTAVRLTIDWRSLGIDPARARLRAPAIANFQAAGSWAPGESIVVPGKKGLLLLIEPK